MLKKSQVSSQGFHPELGQHKRPSDNNLIRLEGHTGLEMSFLK